MSSFGSRRQEVRRRIDDACKAAGRDANKVTLLAAQGLALDTLSTGMSDDLEAAVAEGATLGRVGTALFGPRPTSR